MNIHLQISYVHSIEPFINGHTYKINCVSDSLPYLVTHQYSQWALSPLHALPYDYKEDGFVECYPGVLEGVTAFPIVHIV